MTDIYELPAVGQLPPKVRWGGYVYAIEFSDGAVKVGTTTEPEHRVAKHSGDAIAYGLAARRAWISPDHDEPYKTELSLIRIAEALGGIVRRREYFADCPFDALVERARKLPFPLVDVAAREVNADERFERMKEFFIREVWTNQHEGQTNWDFGESIRRSIGAIFGRAGDRYSVPLVRDEDVPFDLVIQVSDAAGVTAASVLNMDMIDLLETIVANTVRAEALNLRIYAIESGRTDLTARMRCSDLPDEPDEHGSLRPTKSIERKAS